MLHLRHSKKGDTIVVTNDVSVDDDDSHPRDDDSHPRDDVSVRLKPFRSFHSEHYVPTASGLTRIFQRSVSNHPEIKI